MSFLRRSPDRTTTRVAFSLHLLGTLSLEGPAGPLTGRVVQRRQLALLALLEASRERGSSRDKLVGYLWPESAQEKAHHLLADAVYLLRRGLGEKAVLSAGEALRLNPDLVRSDVGAFEDRLERGELEEAVDVYAGPFLDGFYRPGAGAFERWVESERQRLATRYTQALASLARKAEEYDDQRTAIYWWRHLAACDPYDSSVAMRLMGALARAGDPGNAVLHALSHSHVLEVDLGMEPPQDLLELAEQLKSGRRR